MRNTSFLRCHEFLSPLPLGQSLPDACDESEHAPILFPILHFINSRCHLQQQSKVMLQLSAILAARIVNF